ncbi:MAG: hypothetical protein ACMUHX_02440 [bacterium]
MNYTFFRKGHYPFNNDRGGEHLHEGTIDAVLESLLMVLRNIAQMQN